MAQSISHLVDKKLLSRLSLHPGYFICAGCLICAICALLPEGAHELKQEQISPDLSYTGTLEDKQLQGQALLNFSNGDSYEGGLKDSRFDGEGVYTSHEGWKLKATFQQGRVRVYTLDAE